MDARPTVDPGFAPSRPIPAFAVALVGVCALATPTLADRLTFEVLGSRDPALAAAIGFGYDAASGTIAIDVRNTSADHDPRITSFAFNVPSGVDGVSGLTAPAGWSSEFEADGIDTPGPLGAFDLAALSGPNFSGGFAPGGIERDRTAHFTLALRGSGLDLLDERSFLSLLSSLPNGGHGEPANFAVRFQQTGPQGQDSDVGTPTDGAGDDDDDGSRSVPEPAVVWLVALGAAVLMRRRKSIR